MKLNLITLVRLMYYWQVIKLMSKLKPHFYDKKSGEMIDYWSEVYKGNVRRLLNHKYDNF
jgi:hypothetical protein